MATKPSGGLLNQELQLNLQDFKSRIRPCYMSHWIRYLGPRISIPDSWQLDFLSNIFPGAVSVSPDARNPKYANEARSNDCLPFSPVGWE